MTLNLTPFLFQLWLYPFKNLRVRPGVSIQKEPVRPHFPILHKLGHPWLDPLPIVPIIPSEDSVRLTSILHWISPLPWSDPKSLPPSESAASRNLDSDSILHQIPKRTFNKSPTISFHHDPSSRPLPYFLDKYKGQGCSSWHPSEYQLLLPPPTGCFVSHELYPVSAGNNEKSLLLLMSDLVMLIILMVC